MCVCVFLEQSPLWVFSLEQQQLQQEQMRMPVQLALMMCMLKVCMITAGAQALAGMNSTGYAGGATAFTEAASQSTAILNCLQSARLNSSAIAAAAAAAARAALRAGNATAAAAAVTRSLCNPVTAIATAQVFAETIHSSVGCSGAVHNALTCKLSAAAAAATNEGFSQMLLHTAMICNWITVMTSLM